MVLKLANDAGSKIYLSQTFNWTSVVLKLVAPSVLLSPPFVSFNWTSVVLKRIQLYSKDLMRRELLIGPVWY